VTINFPVPYLNNHSLHEIGVDADSFHRKILKNYLNGLNYPFSPKEMFSYNCPHKSCGARFNFYSILNEGAIFTCPTCLQPITLEKGWLIKEKKQESASSGN